MTHDGKWERAGEHRQSQREPHPLTRTEQVEEALEFLSLSAHEIGRARGAMIRAEYMIGATEAIAASLSKASSAEARKAEARSSSQYESAVQRYATAVQDFETLRSRREAAVQRIEVWRTASSSQKAGML